MILPNAKFVHSTNCSLLDDAASHHHISECTTGTVSRATSAYRPPPHNFAILSSSAFLLALPLVASPFSRLSHGASPPEIVSHHLGIEYLEYRPPPHNFATLFS